MAKSKLVNMNKKIAAQVITGFQQISDAVTGNYKRIEDWFVDRYLTMDGESVSDAKIRLQKEKNFRRK